ncbi:MAG: response regulator transcription factor [Pyrinomonadaceae bacterium]
MPRMFENFPNTKALVLSTLNGELDQTRVLKLGASGIVDAKQSEEALIRAIRQVSEGGVCLNQNLINQILNGDKRDRKSGDQKSDGVPGGIYGNDPLTDRELEVIKVISKGLSNKEISKKMFISEATVRHHLSSIYSKLFIEDRLNLVIYAFKNKLVFPQETIEAE